MSERATRNQFIDPALEAAGWSTIVRYPPGPIYDTGAVEEYETSEGPADYVLFHRGDALAAVEAKKLSLGPRSDLVQVQGYSMGFQGRAFNFHGAWTRSPEQQSRTRLHPARSHSGQVEEGPQ